MRTKSTMPIIHSIFISGILLYTSCVLADSTFKKQLYMCQSCHGDTGISPYTSIPNLAKLSNEYIEKQLISFKEEKRIDKTMTPVAKLIKDEDIKKFAQYFSQAKEKQ